MIAFVGKAPCGLPFAGMEYHLNYYDTAEWHGGAFPTIPTLTYGFMSNPFSTAKISIKIPYALFFAYFS
jgi:hypothetical protein